ncbi:LAME_0H16028g1_1 [Lachancea meyersii CBS 8951]|uniref:LAME_0H16028g1_1 n=1 Tax=Lachancea meyersii CBS 8951 TaxID=1266667 RepID=A0A1G4KI09_9SACH|nr:LAME_0H16028g1_1 [Lachancea meyersii CBS 8951]
MSNLYTRRSVAEKDSQPCLVCYLPTTCVLYNASIQDWFYCCEMHIKDNPGFAKPVYSAEYNDAIERMTIVKQKLEVERTKRGSSWDSWVNKLISKGPKQDKEDSNANSDVNAKETAETKPEDAAKPTAESEPQLLKSEYQKLADQVAHGQKNTRSFSLSPVMFESRLDAKKRSYMLKMKSKREQETYTNTDPDELQTKFNFPSIPQK